MSLKLTEDGEELRQRFFELQTFEALAELLDVSEEQLYYYAFIVRANPQTHYKSFEIPKKSGGVREIVAPASPLKIIQRKLNQILQYVYTPKASVHGFIQGRSILTNAKRHLETRARKQYVFNVDIKDFFPSITYYRVVGLLTAKPYELPWKVANVIANLCCYKGKLPQGAPTSPIISNMICGKMDTQLLKLAKESKCIYTRYADDITFSSSLPSIPTSLAVTDERTGQLRAGDALQRIIEDNGFHINPDKVRLHTKFSRQEITGLTVNKFPNVPREYVRQIRAMLHAWEKYGLENAQKEFIERYARARYKEKPSFKQVVRGKIEYLRMVRGDNNLIYLRFRDKLRQLDPGYKPKDKRRFLASPISVYVGTEGRSDWKHLKAVLHRFQAAGDFTDLKIDFWEYEEDPPMNDSELLKRCQYQSEKRLDKTHIYIFDRDNPDIVKKVNESGKGYRKWGNSLFSFAIPVPLHRQDTPDVCIELYYLDTDIIRSDPSGRRLFLSSEFDKKSGRHIKENLNCTDLNKVKRQLTVVDNMVYNEQNKNIALPKDDFATYILKQMPGFDNLDISGFRLIFELIRKIIEDN